MPPYHKEQHRKVLEQHFGLPIAASEARAEVLWDDKCGDGSIAFAADNHIIVNKAPDSPGTQPMPDQAAIDRAVDSAVQAALAKVSKPPTANIPARIEVSEPETQPKAGYGCLGEFLQEVAIADMGRGFRPRLQKYTTFLRTKGLDTQTKTTGYMGEYQDSLGGYLVPSDFSTALMKSTLDTGAILSQCQDFPMQSNKVELPYVNESTRASSTAGGVIAYWMSEVYSSGITVSNPVLGMIALELKELVGAVYVTDVLLSDSPVSIVPLVQTMFRDHMLWRLESDIITGVGGGRPLGLLSSAAHVTVSAETDQDGTTIVPENIDNMYSRMLPSSLGRAVWLANIDCFPQLAKLGRVVGSGGVVVGLGGASITNVPAASIYGRPIIWTEHCKTLGTEGDLWFADLSYYLVGRKVGEMVTSASSVHVRFLYNETTFKFTMRVDGQPALRSALTPENSSNTLSPFVNLATRS